MKEIANDEIIGEIATEIALAESGLDPLAKNKFSSAVGIFQWLKSSWKYYNCEGERLNYKDNITCAVDVMKNKGFSDWNESKKQWYPKLSKEAQLRISMPIIETKIVVFAGGKVKINKKGDIIHQDKIWRGFKDGEPFI